MAKVDPNASNEQQDISDVVNNHLESSLGSDIVEGLDLERYTILSSYKPDGSFNEGSDIYIFDPEAEYSQSDMEKAGELANKSDILVSVPQYQDLKWELDGFNAEEDILDSQWGFVNDVGEKYFLISLD